MDAHESESPVPESSAAEAAIINDTDEKYFAPKLTGFSYIKFLDQFHRIFKPQSYLEIGVNMGKSFARSTCSSIGIDPDFHEIPSAALENKPSALLFKMGSDEFFLKHNPSKIFGRPVDFAFLDGMHLFEFLLRDFINTEKHCKKNSVVVFHDCVPTDLGMARRRPAAHGVQHTRSASLWAGDIWKILPVLQKYRPDLKRLVLDCIPTGLVLLTNLDPENNVLEDNYFKIVDEYMNASLEDIGVAEYVRSLDVRAASSFPDHEALSRKFWL